MEYIIQARQSGKTKYIIDKFLEDPENSYIICINEQEAHRVRNLCQDRRSDLSRMLLVDHIFRAAGLITGMSHQSKVYIDNVDILLRSMYGNVETITMSEE